MIFTLSQIIEKSAETFPKKEAFRCLEESISFEELNLQGNRLACHLVSSGLHKGDRVGIFMNRCLKTATAVYGSLKSGAVYVPLDPFLPLNRTISILEDCGIQHLITTNSQLRKIKKLVEQTSFLKSVIGIEENIHGISAFSWEDIFSLTLNDFCVPKILGGDLAFILYTSGSTGRPKGIMHTHNSALNLAKLAVKQYDFNESDRVGTFAPLHFDPSTFGYYAAPLVGATAIIIPDAHLKLPISLAALASKEKITIWFSVPLMLIQVMQNGKIESLDFSSLRWVLFAGEVFVTKHLRSLMQKWPNAKFSNLYGPAEVILCTYYNLPGPPENDDAIPIGTVWENTEYKILDANDNEVEKGSSGEFVVRTGTMMQGYWNNKELTEKSFFRVNFALDYDHIYYRTGDLVKENTSNELLFLGRNDRQIKFRGYRVELDEIELTFLKNKSVEEVAVVEIESSAEDTELAAIIKPTKGEQADRESILSFCKTHLPSYSIPKILKFLNDFPRTSSGKISRVEITRMLKEKEI